MPTYQVNRDLRSGIQAQIEAFEILNSAALNATQGYGFTIQDVSLDGSGRLRIRVSGTFPAAEIESFAGDLIAV